MKYVIPICILVIQIRTSVKNFSVCIIQIEIRVESIQIRPRAGKRLYEHSNNGTKAFQFVISSINLAFILRMCICIHLLKLNA